jgi:hypothetical protein
MNHKHYINGEIMKKIFIGFLTLTSISAFAGTEITCKSAKYLVSIMHNSSGRPVLANYAINGTMNDAADVEIERFYKSNRVLAAQLKVDGKSSKFELFLSKNSKGIYTGKIFAGKNTLEAKCIEKYVVTTDDRDDDSDVNN